MSILKKLAGETVIYGLSTIIARLLNFLLVPFYTDVFDAAKYGVVTELYAYSAFLNVVLTFGMETTYFRFCNKEGADKAHVFQSIQSLLIMGTILLCGLGMLFSSEIAFVLKYPSQNHLILYLLGIIGTDTLLALSFAKLRQEGRAKKFASVKIFNILLTIGLNLWFLKIHPLLDPSFKADVSYVFFANLAANLAQVFFFPSDVAKWFRLTFSWPNARQYMQYGFPLMIMGLAGMTNEVVDRILLKYLLPTDFYPGKTQLAALGIYGACYKLSIFMSLGIQAFRYAAEPFFFARAKDKNSTELYAKVLHYFTLLCCGVLMIISFNLDWIKYLLSRPEFREGLYVVPLLLSANLFLGIYYNLSIWYKLTDRTRYGMWISLAGGALTLFLNIFLIPQMGYLGCAWATLTCYFTMSVVSYFLGQKYYFIPYRVIYLSTIIALSGIISYFLWDTTFSSGQIQNIFYKNAFCFFVLISFYFVGKKTKSL
jgi:O-antigen/teichoic acid export membrane protein